MASFQLQYINLCKLNNDSRKKPDTLETDEEILEIWFSAVQVRSNSTEVNGVNPVRKENQARGNAKKLLLSEHCWLGDYVTRQQMAAYACVGRRNCS